MRQYYAAKQQNPDALLFFRMGDFYELFYEDAKVAARELQITLTARDREKTQPMCGVPYHAAEAYLTRLLRKGYRVAICEQMEDPKLTKKIVRREVTRVLSPGTAIDSALGPEQNNYLAAVYADASEAKAGSKGVERTAGLAYLDLSTAEFRATEFSGANALALCVDELLKLNPSEVILPGGASSLHPSAPKPSAPGTPDLFAKDGEFTKALERVKTRTPVEDWVFTPDFALPLLERQMGSKSLEGFGLAEHRAAAVAAGAIVHYVRTTQQSEAVHVDSLRFYRRAEFLHLDQVTVRNLELLDPLFHDAGRETTLFYALDACATPMGKRMLRAAILRPLLDKACIHERYEAVDAARQDLILREELRRGLAGILDLERLLARISLDSAGPRDVLSLAASLKHLPDVKGTVGRLAAGAKAPAFSEAESARLKPCPDTKHLFWARAGQNLDTLEDLCAAIMATIVPEPPLTLADGGVIQPGMDAELDELRTIGHSGRSAIAAIEERERQRTGIGSLKVRFNSVFGYYIEITKSNLANVPADYERKQTLVNAERFTTPEIKEYETKVLTAQERSVEIEKRIFAALRARLMENAGRIRRTSTVVAEIDLVANFAHLAAMRNYTRPVLDSSCVMEIAAGRHPVIERLMEDAGEGRFVPNDLYLDGSGNVAAPNLLLITGPNMGGKSTYLRQAALLVILAQMGSFVPAERMRYGIVDRVYTRIGASDNVARGRSTFMVEMTETATILNTATAQSLILLDEMGRGTSTFDGLALAWATLEYLQEKVGARALFATHYHELTLLAEQLPKLKNLRVAVKESAQGIVFLHRIEEGPANKSYGIDVARLAGLPAGVIQRARQVLKQHERSERHNVAVETEPSLQMTMFTPLSQRILDRLNETDINSLTPLEALNLLSELKVEIKGGQ
ncbi:DNA mismatch repair protein MutS [Paracidobacterium acidisoli]|uniref:DNA mismatch repair protein MutS n=1 Tax=Paracidobacterium acidisoli TaxID=2303751 RepID=A0A372ISR0_9BACT|nr:DNA mismatch repair protein MutS [Paracidobacterium acidisoli]MBT9330152.1 DNA mismatch repair protein MutS [Paracidobacterium acidisoli]